MKKILLVLGILTFILWLNMYRVPTQFIIENRWKNYDNFSSVFKDVISFDTCHSSPLRLDNNGIISKNGTVWGSIIEKHHNYDNTYITVVDFKNDTASYIMHIIPSFF